MLPVFDDRSTIARIAIGGVLLTRVLRVLRHGCKGVKRAKILLSATGLTDFRRSSSGDVETERIRFGSQNKRIEREERRRKGTRKRTELDREKRIKGWR